MVMEKDSEKQQDKEKIAEKIESLPLSPDFDLETLNERAEEFEETGGNFRRFMGCGG